MNFFKLYIGDYQRDTAHLSITEHGAYLLMLQHYYATEKPLPTGKALHRMLRAQDKAEREAIDTIAAEFWTATADGLVNGRADDEITKADAQADTNQRIAKEREARRKAARDAAREANEKSTNRATNGQPNQTPDTRHQTPEETALAVSPREAVEPEKPQPAPSRAGLVCRRMRAAGLPEVNPSHPKLIALFAAGITDDELEAAAADAAKRGKGFAYALAAAEGQRRDAATEALPPIPGSEPAHWSETAGGVKAMGVSLGLTYTGLEQFSVYRAKVIEAKRKADEAMGVAA